MYLIIKRSKSLFGEFIVYKQTGGYNKYKTEYIFHNGEKHIDYFDRYLGDDNFDKNSIMRHIRYGIAHVGLIDRVDIDNIKLDHPAIEFIDGEYFIKEKYIRFNRCDVISRKLFNNELFSEILFDSEKWFGYGGSDDVWVYDEKECIEFLMLLENIYKRFAIIEFKNKHDQILISESIIKGSINIGTNNGDITL